MTYDTANINICPVLVEACGKVRSPAEARALVRDVVKALFAAGNYSIHAKDGWIARIPYASKGVSAWLRADAALLGGTWVSSRVITSGRGAFGRLGGSSLRSGYRAGYLKNNAK